MTRRWIRVFFVLVLVNIILAQINRTTESRTSQEVFTYFGAEAEEAEKSDETESPAIKEMTEGAAADQVARTAKYQKMNHNYFGGFLEGVGTEIIEKGISQKFSDDREWIEHVAAEENSSVTDDIVSILRMTLLEHYSDTTWGWFADFPEFRELGAEEFELDREERASLQVSCEIPENCGKIFHVPLKEGIDTYVFEYYPKGYGEDDTVIRLAERSGDDFTVISEFATDDKKRSNGVVIQCGMEFYYVYLLYNEWEKEFDGVKACRLGGGEDTKTLLVKSLPEVYSWKEVYSLDSGDISEVPYVMMDKVKIEFSTENYLSGGTGEKPKIYYGNGEKKAFVSPEKFDGTLYEADISNSGLPVFVWKEYALSPDEKSWFLKVSFYYYDSELNTMVKLSDLSVDKWAENGVNLTQLWFEEIEGEIYTFRLYHLSEYNYLLSVVLLKGNKVSPVQTYAASPIRTFQLTESAADTEVLKDIGTAR